MDISENNTLPWILWMVEARWLFRKFLSQLAILFRHEANKPSRCRAALDRFSGNLPLVPITNTAENNKNLFIMICYFLSFLFTFLCCKHEDDLMRLTGNWLNLKQHFYISHFPCLVTMISVIFGPGLVWSLSRTARVIQWRFSWFFVFVLFFFRPAMKWKEDGVFFCHIFSL